MKRTLPSCCCHIVQCLRRQIAWLRPRKPWLRPGNSGSGGPVFFMPQFPHLEREDENHIYLMGLL